MITEAKLFQLQERMQAPLPGKEAQYRMAHVARQAEYPIPDHARKAGVLALFYPNSQGQWHLALIERVSHHSNDRHGGQISFPGGGFEAEDGTLMRTALRETEEEIGIHTSDVQVLGPLTDLYIPVSNYLVHPFAGILSGTPTFSPQWSEVKAVVEAPLDLLCDPATRQTTDLHISSNMLLKDVPYFNVFGKVIWGATAMMLSELLELLEP
ncbi:MAG: CoA pyrophosphatase [Saprospirales bacterium]|nr:CoA pyrophosphatase [Saprospirales bacterium]